MSRPVALGVTLLVMSGGSAAYASSAKSVTVNVDGERRTVSTHGDSVREVLDEEGLEVGSHDLLAPAEGTVVKDGSTVVLRRGREMALAVDGVERTVWVTASSVDEAIGQLDLRAAGALLSADRSREIPLKGFSLDVRTRKDVQVLDGGKMRRTATNALLVKDVLRELKVNLRPNDRLSLKPDAKVRDGLVIRVTRLDGRRVSEDLEIPFGTERRSDSSMYEGDTKVLRRGSVGVLHKTYLLNYVDGKLAQRRTATVKRTASPVSKIVAVGTKSRPQAPTSAPSVASGPSATGLNWGALAACESGGDPHAVSSSGTYHGLYQFSITTWQSVGGSGSPSIATPSEQTSRAELLYKQSGRGQWPVCGQYL